MNDRARDHGKDRAGVLRVLALAQPPTPLPTIDVKEPKDVAAVTALNDAMAGLSQKVTACVTGGRTRA